MKLSWRESICALLFTLAWQARALAGDVSRAFTAMSTRASDWR